MVYTVIFFFWLQIRCDLALLQCGKTQLSEKCGEVLDSGDQKSLSSHPHSTGGHPRRPPIPVQEWKVQKNEQRTSVQVSRITPSLTPSFLSSLSLAFVEWKVLYKKHELKSSIQVGRNTPTFSLSHLHLSFLINWLNRKYKKYDYSIKDFCTCEQDNSPSLSLS